MDQNSYGVGNRLLDPPSTDLQQFYQSVYLDGFTEDDLADSSWINVVHVDMLERQGVISTEVANQIKGVINEIEKGAFTVEAMQPSVGDTLPNIERYVTSVLGSDVGGQLHTGRSRGDYYATLSRMRMRRWLFSTFEAILLFRKQLIELARQHVSTIMPGYTHLQHAQPITLGHYLLGAINSLERDCERLRDSYSRINVSPLGLGIVSGTSFAIDRQYTARKLGFSALGKNSRDIGDRDYSLEFGSNIATCMIHCHRLATDFYEWSTSEFSIVKVSDKDAMTSSMMPQKANPVILEEIRGLTGYCIGNLSSAYIVAKGSPANNIEITMVDSPVISATMDATNALRKFAAIAPRITFDTGRMMELTKSSWSQATDLADSLVKLKGMAFRDAHEVVGTLVANSIPAGASAVGLTSEDLATASEQALGYRIDVPQKTLDEILDLTSIVESRDVYGGPKLERVQASVAESEDLFESDQSWLENENARLRSLRQENFQAV